MNKDKITSELNLIFKKSKKIGKDHAQIARDIEIVKRKLMQELQKFNVGNDFLESEEFHVLKNKRICELYSQTIDRDVNLENSKLTGSSYYPTSHESETLLSNNDFREIEARISSFTTEFNKKYNLDKWDYVIGVICGSIAGIIDLKYVGSPLHPHNTWDKEAEGGVNKFVQFLLNLIVTPEVSKKMGEKNEIGSADTSINSGFLVPPRGSFTPKKHRLLSLSHDPILGFIFGFLDMKNNTCTIIDEGAIKILPCKKRTIDFDIFKMIGHLLSDVNAPSDSGNRGMGLPAPFMAILRMLEFIPIDGSNFGKEIENMYLNGYDFRQFMSTSTPLFIMEILVRCFYVAKQMRKYDAKFGETLVSTMPMNFRNNQRFRLILTIANGVFCGINTGKVFLSKNSLDINYTSWLGLAWHGVHSIKWLLHDKHNKFLREFEESEKCILMDTIKNIDELEIRSQKLPQESHT